MTELALVEETSVREVDVDGGGGVLLVFWGTGVEGLGGCVSATGGGINAGMHGRGSKRYEEGDAWRRTCWACACLWMCRLMWCLDRGV